jgi:hypothetical protein
VRSMYLSFCPALLLRLVPILAVLLLVSTSAISAVDEAVSER